MIACSSIVLVTWLQSPQSPPQLPPQQPPPPPPPAAPAATKYEFPTKLAPGEARLIEIRAATSTTIKIEAAGHATDSKERSESTTWIVDTLLDPATQPKDHVWSGRRRYVKAQSTKDGVVDDPEVNGLEADVWVDDTKQIHFQSLNERAASIAMFDSLIAEAQSFGLCAGIAFPESAAVGDEFEMPFAALAPFCLTADGRMPKASAHLRFESVDPKKNLARWKGPVHVDETIDKSAEQLAAPYGMKATATYDGIVSFDYDVAAHRITRIVCRANGAMQGEFVGDVSAKMSATLVIESTINCSVGAPAASALFEKTQFRDVPHEINNVGVSIALPSHFTSFYFKGLTRGAFRSLLYGNDAAVTVIVFPLPLKGKNLKEAGDATRKDLEGTAGVTVKNATASGGLGAASACEYTLRNLHGLNAVFQLEPGRFVVVQCECFESAWAERSKEFPKYFQSLKKLPAGK
jgi:hypothetical protein